MCVVRLASWNLEWLNRREGHGVVKRAEEDYARLRRYAEALRADVIAFQEVDGPDAARLVFAPSRFDVYVTADRDPQRAGFAVRRGLPATQHPDVASLSQAGLRSGADVTVTACGRDVRLLAVHLKSGCFEGALGQGTRACVKLGAQVPALEAWIDARAREATPFAVLGDFNRRFLPNDTLFPELDDGNPPDADLTDAGAGVRSTCWGGKYPDLIDHIVLDRRAGRWVRPGSFAVALYDAADLQHRAKLSDHCPITVELEPGRR